MPGPARRRFRLRSLPPRRGLRPISARDPVLKCSLPAPRSAAAARRAAAAAEPAAAREPPATRVCAAARTAGIDEEIQYDVEGDPAEPGRYDEQRQEGDGGRYQEPVQPTGRRLMVEAQRRTLLPLRRIGREHGDDVIDAARDPTVKVAHL